MAQNDGSNNPEGELRRSRSLSKSLKGLFKSSSPTSKQQAIAADNVNASKGGDKLKKLAKSKELELEGKRHEGAANRNTDNAPPSLLSSKAQSSSAVPAKRHLPIPDLGKLSLLPHTHNSLNGGTENVSQESLISDDDPAKNSKNFYAARNPSDHSAVEEGESPDTVFEEEEEEPLIDAELSKDMSSVRRTKSLQRKDSRSRSGSRSRSLSMSSKYRRRSPTFSASNLLQHAEGDSKRILATETFQLFEDGHHEHTLKVTPIVLESQDGDHRVKSTFSLSGFFKSHKDDDRLESALSLLPRSRFEFHKRLSRVLDEELKEENEESEKAQEKEIPAPVNPQAAIGVDELKLINKLSKKIHDGSNKDTDSDEIMAKKQYTLCEKYGKPIGVIGNGAYGTVKVCCKVITCRSDARPSDETFVTGSKMYYAVKELKPKPDEPREKFGTRLTSEFIIGHSLSSHHKDERAPPNILKILDLMQTNDGFVEVMEFCPSGDLYSLLSRTAKSHSGLHPLEADCFMKQLLNGVQYMHDHGIAHCDLKPENILFSPTGVLKICDFGTSCVFQTAWEKKVHFQSGAVGSEPYVAPEEFIANMEYDPRLVDCWSCGVIYCTMVLGHYLWKVPLMDKDSVYASFVEQIRTDREFDVFEGMKHVTVEISRCRKMCLYGIFQWNPEKRISIDKLLLTPWMKRTRCCVFYKDHK